MPEIVYTKAQADTLLGLKVAAVRTVAGKPLTSDVTISKGDVGLSAVDNVGAAALRDRSTHTGTQAQSTVTGLVTALGGLYTKAQVDALLAEKAGIQSSTIVRMELVDTVPASDPAKVGWVYLLRGSA